MAAEGCQYHDPANGRACGAPGRPLVLANDLGGLVQRCLCREHSDWMEAPEALAERQALPRDRAFLRAVGVSW